MMPSRSTPENGLAQRAYLKMRERIIGGEYAIGQVISRRRIAADLGISFLPASEALLRLECEGLLESRPRAGTRIRIPARQDVEGYFTVREALEVQAALMFAQCATREERAELMKLSVRVDTLAKRGSDLLSYLAPHEQLHLKIAEYARSAALEDAIRKQSALGSAWLCAMKSPIPQDGQPHHEVLVKALTRQKPASAAEAMRAHMQADRDSTLRTLEPYFEVNSRYRQTYSRARRSESGDAVQGAQPKALALGLP